MTGSITTPSNPLSSRMSIQVLLFLKLKRLAGENQRPDMAEMSDCGHFQRRNAKPVSSLDNVTLGKNAEARGPHSQSIALAMKELTGFRSSSCFGVNLCSPWPCLLRLQSADLPGY